jgi:hypothetical protein
MTDSVEERVRERLNQLTMDVSVPAGLVAKAVRRHRRRRAMTRVGIAAVTAAVTVAAVITATGDGGAATGAGTRIQTTAYVTQRMTSMLSPGNLDKTIQGASVHYHRVWWRGKLGPPQGGTTTWSYRGAARLEDFFTTDGRLTAEYWLPSQVYAQMSTKTWGVTKGAVPPGPWVPATATPSPPPANGCRTGNLTATPAFIRATLRCGGLAVAGYAQVDGRQVIKLAGTKRLPDGSLTLYVSPVTYLPVQAVMPTATEDFLWRPATSANLGMLKVDIPTGFRQVPGTDFTSMLLPDILLPDILPDGPPARPAARPGTKRS